jgi:hypothetical protein
MKSQQEGLAVSDDLTAVELKNIAEMSDEEIDEYAKTLYAQMVNSEDTEA